MPRPATKISTKTDTDTPWKEMLDQYFEDFMKLLFPKIHKRIDWQKGYEFHDKELQKVVRDAKLGRRYADKLVKVWLTGGQSVFVYIHGEVQGQFEEDFPQRIFVYNYRLYDRYGQPVISLVVLGDSNKDWYPNHYGFNVMGCRLAFDFPVVKLLDYQDQWEKLERSRNPFALVVRIHLIGLKTRRSMEQRLQWKISFYKELYQRRKSSQQDYYELWRFLDWVLVLPPNLARKFNQFVEKYEEAQKMPYLTSIEKMGIAKGRREGRQEGRQEGIQVGTLQTYQRSLMEVLQARFKKVPQTLKGRIQAIEEPSLLAKLLTDAALTDSLQAFERLLKKPA